MANSWLEHVKKYWKSHPALSYGECLKKAKSTYKKKGGKRKTRVAKKPTRRRRGARR
jgi:hypothetical protein